MAAQTAPSAPQPAQKLDNLFFIEEPKSIRIAESKGLFPQIRTILRLHILFMGLSSSLQKAQRPSLPRLAVIPFLV